MSEIEQFLQDSGAADSALSFDEFLRIYTVQTTSPQTDELKECFDIFDTNHDGFMEAHDFRQIFTVLGFEINDEDLSSIIAEVKPSLANKVVFHFI